MKYKRRRARRRRADFSYKEASELRLYSFAHDMYVFKWNIKDEGELAFPY